MILFLKDDYKRLDLKFIEGDRTLGILLKVKLCDGYVICGRWLSEVLFVVCVIYLCLWIWRFVIRVSFV